MASRILRRAGKKRRKTVAEKLTARQAAEEAASAIFAQEGVTDTHRNTQIEMGTPEMSRYLYQNLVSNVEGQIEHWNRKAAREPNAETAKRLRSKAEGLGYALRLLAAFEPEFRELTGAAIRFGSEGSA